MATATLLQRCDVPTELTWDLSKIFTSEDEFEKTFKDVESLLPKMSAFKGELAKSSDKLLKAFEMRDEISQKISKLYCYSRMNSDTDTTDSHYQELFGRVQELYGKVGNSTSFMSPEILSIDEKELASWIEKNEGLKLYKHELDELNRERDHVRSPEVEEVLSDAAKTYSGPGNIHGMFDNADLRFPDVEDENGEMSPLTAGNWASKWLDNPNREARQRAYETMFGTFDKWRNTMAAVYANQVKINIFKAKSRKYSSPRAMALEGINVPESVYDSLIDTVHKNLPKVQKYLEVRKKILGLDELHWYDLYVPLVQEVDYKIKYDEAQKKILTAISKMGSEYSGALESGFNSRWIDVMESEGKRSGAYSWGTYGTPPYMLLNWHDTLDSMFTLAHEAGHSMHSYFSRKTQPFPYCSYTLFVAEVASTCNEALLAYSLLEETDDPAIRRYILNHQLESVRLTLVRQTLFAEFEKIAHDKAQAGEALTPDTLCKIHLDLNRKYYEPAAKIDDKIGIEWARIPHFYSSFYVYQYSTGISAALSLARQIIEEGKPAVKRYLKFLSSGSSDYSINLLREAGVDLSTSQPIQEAFDTFQEYLDKFEALV